MFVGEVALYIVNGYIVNNYCLMFVREVAPYIVIGYKQITIYGATSLTNIKH
jgi:hypothetical protein